jgi:hypothetical protein
VGYLFLAVLGQFSTTGGRACAGLIYQIDGSFSEVTVDQGGSLLHLTGGNVTSVSVLSPPPITNPFTTIHDVDIDLHRATQLVGQPNIFTGVLVTTAGSSQLVLEDPTSNPTEITFDIPGTALLDVVLGEIAGVVRAPDPLLPELLPFMGGANFIFDISGITFTADSTGVTAQLTTPDQPGSADFRLVVPEPASFALGVLAACTIGVAQLARRKDALRRRPMTTRPLAWGASRV